MNLIVRPTPVLKGSFYLPASKSYSIRAFIIAACGGTSKIISPSNCDDAKVAVDVARQLGAKITLSKKIWTVLARDKKITTRQIDVGESGTVLRFLLPLLAVQGNSIRVIGTGTLKGRPNLSLVKTLKAMGACIDGSGSVQSIPIDIKKGKIRGGKISIAGTVSSQFISALLIACPELREDTKLFVKGKLVSQDYITMTRQVLKKAGIQIQDKKKYFHIPGRQKFKGLKNFIVPSDYGLAAFFLVAGALLRSRITLKGFLKDDLLQADGKILDLLRKMGARFVKTNQGTTISGPFHLTGGSFSLKDCPDLVPIMAVAALFAKGKTRLYDIGHARVKESDRISDLRKELLKIGANVKEKRNELIVVPRPCYKSNISVNPHHDHRLAMAFSVLGLKLGANIKDIECTAKSYPDFVKDLAKLGARISKVKNR
ncbi:MAG: 3-phosphoshikimate 1-carboxyvinyltransferase [Candidatus Omnitrophota bacterium]